MYEYLGFVERLVNQVADVDKLPLVEPVREIVLKTPGYPQGRGCLLRCACHRNECPICSQFRE